MEESTGVISSLRRLIVFQLKLLADAGRDLLLSPISFAVAIIDILFRLEGKDSLFNKMLELGIKSDHFINLFGQFGSDDTISALVDEVGNSVVSQSKNSMPSGDSSSAKDASETTRSASTDETN